MARVESSGTDCVHGHTKGWYTWKGGRVCVECKRLANQRNPDRRRDKEWRRIEIRVDEDTYNEISNSAKRANVTRAVWSREALEWRMMELGQ